jgi:hypothetical protein
MENQILFNVVNGVLCYKWVDDSGTQSLRLFVLKSLSRKIIEDCHVPSSSGHQGERRITELITVIIGMVSPQMYCIILPTASCVECLKLT